jgi:hypothetical protein
MTSDGGAAGQPSHRTAGTEFLPAGPTVESVECLRCSASIRRDDLFCEHCGADQAAPAPWSIEVSADRAWFDRIGARGVAFPIGRAPTRLEFVDDQITIGRASSSRRSFPDIDLSGGLGDPGVSHHHAVIRRLDSDRFEVVDLGSTNGTTVNDDRESIPPHAPVVVGPGDHIRVGAWTTIVLNPPRTGGAA